MQPSLFQPEAAEQAVEAGFAEIVFDRPLDHAYTYAVPTSVRDQIAVGKRVLAPFGRGDKQTTGFCVGLSSTKPERKVKAIVQVLDDGVMTYFLYFLCGFGLLFELNEDLHVILDQFCGEA